MEKQMPNLVDSDIAKMLARKLGIPIFHEGQGADENALQQQNLAKQMCDPIELDEHGNHVTNNVLRERIIKELASPLCTGLRAFELQRIWMRQPGNGLRGWQNILRKASEIAAETKPDYVYIVIPIRSPDTDDSESEEYAIVQKKYQSGQSEYVCTVYIPGNVNEAMRIANEIAKALNAACGASQLASTPPST